MAPKAKNAAAKAETKIEEVKVEAVEVTEEVKAEPAKKTAAKKTTKTAANTEEKATTEKTTTKKAADKKAELFVQFSGMEFSYDDILEKVKADYIAKSGKKTISSIKIYLKPEEKMAYYVANEKFADAVYLG